MNIFFNSPSYTSLRLASSFGSFKIAAIILTIVLVVVLYCTLLKGENEEEGLKEKIKSFLTFKTFCIGKVIEVIFTIQFCFNLIYGCLQLFVNPFSGLMYIIVYNLALRLIAEFIMLFVRIKENTDRKCNCNCENGCDCGCGDDCDCTYGYDDGCDCDCDCNYEIEDIDLDEEIKDADTAIIVEDITDEVLEDMNKEKNNGEKSKKK